MVDLGPLYSDDPRVRMLRQPSPPRWHALRGLLHRVARRCPVHDRASHAVISRLEQQLGMQPSEPPSSFVDAHYDPMLVSCGYSWCPLNGVKFTPLRTPPRTPPGPPPPPPRPSSCCT